MSYRMPDVPTTKEQWQVIAWSAIVLFLISGTAGFYVAWDPPAEKLEEALELRRYCWISWGLATGIYGVRWLLDRSFI